MPVNRTPVRFRSIDEGVAWLEQRMADQARVLRTNLTLAVAAGELDVDAFDDAIEAADEMADEARVMFRRVLLDAMSPAKSRTA